MNTLSVSNQQIISIKQAWYCHCLSNASTVFKGSSSVKKEGKILIVDDDEDILTAGKLLLKRHFSQISTCNVPENIPLLLAGGAGGRLKQRKRSIECKPGNPHANLLLSIARIMGVETDSFNGVSTGTVDI